MKKCALVVGHKKASPGAMNKSTGVTEFEFNDSLAIDIESVVSGVVVQRIYRRTYESLPSDINTYGPDFIISLHCNAYDGDASGTEVLYYHRSTKGREMAALLNQNLAAVLGLHDRGIKARSVEDRGGHLLKYTHAPCVIAEPFFIDNDNDFDTGNRNRDALIEAYASSIMQLSE